MIINNIGIKYSMESLREYSLILIYTKNRIRDTRGLKKSEMTLEILCSNEDFFPSIIRFNDQIYHYNLKKQLRRMVGYGRVAENLFDYQSLFRRKIFISFSILLLHLLMKMRIGLKLKPFFIKKKMLLK